MNAIDRIVVAGGGQAAVQAIDTLRRLGHRGSIALVSAEPHLPYQRPPLSKKFLAGSLEQNRLLLRPQAYYTEHGIECHLERRVVEIDRREQRVRDDRGLALGYDALLLATGTRPRQLSAAGANLDGIHYLRTIADADRLQRELAAARRVVIVGGGYIGLEVAATCRERGLEVTVLEMADRLMSRVVCPETSAFFEEEHFRRGVRVFREAQVQGFEADASGRVRSVRCEDGSEHLADLALVGVGALANDQLAVAADLESANGIVVDSSCRTSDPHIYAAGDCTNFFSARYQRRMRLESVDNAYEQGILAATAMLGAPSGQDKVPWFWSDQYDLKLIIVGLSAGHDRVVVRGRPFERSFSVCYLRNGTLIAIDTINSPKDQMAARKLVGAGLRPALDKLADPTCPLKDCF
jgi:3-phenylpropionate/trans-cinnamate dioxygenase ferredoxin reductase subunit